MSFQFVKTEPGSDPIIVEGYFAAAPDAVYRAWTEPEMVLKWFGPTPGSLLTAEIDLRIGGVWRFVMIDDGSTIMGFRGVYLEIEPNRRLVFDWSKFSEAKSGAKESTSRSRVEINLSPQGSGTNIQIIHSAIDDQQIRKGFAGGWEHGMTNLHQYLLSVSTKET